MNINTKLHLKIQWKQAYIKSAQLCSFTTSTLPDGYIRVDNLTIPPIAMKVIQAKHSAGRGPVLLLKLLQERNCRQQGA